ncbi:MAG: hypothetical protein ACLGH4_04915 [Actinomycetes bacterium]
MAARSSDYRPRSPRWRSGWTRQLERRRTTGPSSGTTWPGTLYPADAQPLVWQAAAAAVAASYVMVLAHHHRARVRDGQRIMGP